MASKITAIIGSLGIICSGHRPAHRGPGSTLNEARSVCAQILKARAGTTINCSGPELGGMPDVKEVTTAGVSPDTSGEG
jgi:hypothetical protein